MRLRVIEGIIYSFFLFLFAGLWYTQITHGPLYQRLSEQNRVRLVVLDAPRGRIYDSQGRLLVANRLSFDLAIIPQGLRRPGYTSLQVLDGTLAELSQMLAVDKDALYKAYRNGYVAPFAPVVVARDVEKRLAISLEERRSGLAGLVVVTRPVRRYLYNELGSHLIGYLGKITEEELERLKDYGFRIRDIVGRSGIESSFDNYLRGKDGGMQIEVDSVGRQVGRLGRRDPVAGKDLHLTIDIELQRFVEGMLEGKKGAVVALDPRDGAVLAMASKPGFDPNIFLGGSVPQKGLKRLLNSPDAPLVNRAISGRYAPGSIFKVVVALAGLETGNITSSSQFACKGSFIVGGQEFSCWDKEGHGPQNLRQSLSHSCNVFFYYLGMRLGVDELVKYARIFEFGELTGIELPHEGPGFVPSRGWKRRIKGEVWYSGETANFSIGQGPLLTTPLQIVRMLSGVANGGYLVKPYLVKRIEDVELAPPRPKKINISPENLAIVRDALSGVVEWESGTGHRAYIPGLNIAAKTGTAQTGGEHPHAWFVCFVPVEDARIALVVFLEHGGSGGDDAADIAREIINFFYNIKG